MSENTKKYYQEADKGRKDKKEKNKCGSEGSLLSMLLPSILGMCLCCILFLGTTWAWFTSSASTGVATIRAGSFAIESVKVGESDLSKTGEQYTLLEQDSQEITITSSGVNRSGYYILTFKNNRTDEEKVYFTNVIELNEGKLVYSVKITGGKDYKLEIKPCWKSPTERPNIYDNKIELSTSASLSRQASKSETATEKDITQVEEQENSQTLSQAGESTSAGSEGSQGQDDPEKSNDEATSSDNQSSEETTEETSTNRGESVDPQEATDSDQSAAPDEGSGTTQGGGE